MKKYREKITASTFFVMSTHPDRFIHDIIKGWGRVSPSGKTVLWETWVRPKKTRSNPKEGDWSKFTMPMVKTPFPDLIIADLVGTQPMSGSVLPIKWFKK